MAYRNVVWNIKGCDIRLNKPSYHCLVVNNTMLGNTGNWGRWKTDWMYGSVYINNAVGGTIAPHAQAAFAGNTYKVPAADLSKDSFASYPRRGGQRAAGSGTVWRQPGQSGPTSRATPGRRGMISPIRPIPSTSRRTPRCAISYPMVPLAGPVGAASSAPGNPLARRRPRLFGDQAASSSPTPRATRSSALACS